MFIDVKSALYEFPTDKDSGVKHPKAFNDDDGHRYGELYSLILTTQRAKAGRPLRILEVGVYHGYSMDAWNSLDEIEMAVGTDITTEKIHGDISRFIFEKLDGYKQESIDFLLDKYGKFDVIIDDGPHTWETQRYFLTNYDKLLSDDGILVCEDVQYKNIDSILKIRDEYNLFIFDLRWNSRQTELHKNGKRVRKKHSDEMIIIRRK